jgi:hypothetical protein
MAIEDKRVIKAVTVNKDNKQGVTVAIVLTYARHSRSGSLINYHLTTDPLAGQVTTLGYIDVAHPSPS